MMLLPLKAHVRPLRQLVFKKDGRVVCVPFPPTYDSDKLSALLRERDVQGAEPFQICLGVDEGPDSFEAMRPVLTQALGKFEATAYDGVGSSKPETVLSGSTGAELQRRLLLPMCPH